MAMGWAAHLAAQTSPVEPSADPKPEAQPTKPANSTTGTSAQPAGTQTDGAGKTGGTQAAPTGTTQVAPAGTAEPGAANTGSTPASSSGPAATQPTQSTANPVNRRRENPRRPVTEHRDQPAADEADNAARIVPISQEGIVTEVPDFHQDLIPGFQRGDVEVLHGDADDNPPVGVQEPEVIPDSEEALEGEPGPSILDRLSSWLGEFELNQSIINTLLLILIVVVFVIYRMRGGRSRRNF